VCATGIASQIRGYARIGAGVGAFEENGQHGGRRYGGRVRARQKRLFEALHVVRRGSADEVPRPQRLGGLPPRFDKGESCGPRSQLTEVLVGVYVEICARAFDLGWRLRGGDRVVQACVIRIVPHSGQALERGKVSSIHNFVKENASEPYVAAQRCFNFVAIENSSCILGSGS
jgi:hypothetical protein